MAHSPAAPPCLEELPVLFISGISSDCGRLGTLKKWRLKGDPAQFRVCGHPDLAGKGGRFCLRPIKQGDTIMACFLASFISVVALIILIAHASKRLRAG
jgi:hypothetical protein